MIFLSTGCFFRSNWVPSENEWDNLIKESGFDGIEWLIPLDQNQKTFIINSIKKSNLPSTIHPLKMTYLKDLFNIIEHVKTVTTKHQRALITIHPPSKSKSDEIDESTDLLRQYISANENFSVENMRFMDGAIIPHANDKYFIHMVAPGDIISFLNFAESIPMNITFDITHFAQSFKFFNPFYDENLINEAIINFIKQIPLRNLKLQSMHMSNWNPKAFHTLLNDGILDIPMITKTALTVSPNCIFVVETESNLGKSRNEVITNLKKQSQILKSCYS